MDQTRRTAAPRPESTVAQSFAADLDSMFGLSPEVDGLSRDVETKKANIHSGTAELQELEARLRATEERLAKVSRNSSPARPGQTNAGAVRAPVNENEQLSSGHVSQSRAPTQYAAYPTRGLRPEKRPPHNREDTESLMSGMPGHLAGTAHPHNTNNDYVMVESQGTRKAGGYGTSVS